MTLPLSKSGQELRNGFLFQREKTVLAARGAIWTLGLWWRPRCSIPSVPDNTQECCNGSVPLKAKVTPLYHPPRLPPWRRSSLSHLRVHHSFHYASVCIIGIWCFRKILFVSCRVSGMTYYSYRGKDTRSTTVILMSEKNIIWIKSLLKPFKHRYYV